RHVALQHQDRLVWAWNYARFQEQRLVRLKRDGLRPSLANPQYGTPTVLRETAQLHVATVERQHHLCAAHRLNSRLVSSSSSIMLIRARKMVMFFSQKADRGLRPTKSPWVARW